MCSNNFLFSKESFLKFYKVIHVFKTIGEVFEEVMTIVENIILRVLLVHNLTSSMNLEPFFDEINFGPSSSEDSNILVEPKVEQCTRGIPSPVSVMSGRKRKANSSKRPRTGRGRFSGRGGGRGRGDRGSHRMLRRSSTANGGCVDDVYEAFCNENTEPEEDSESLQPLNVALDVFEEFDDMEALDQLQIMWSQSDEVMTKGRVKDEEFSTVPISVTPSASQLPDSSEIVQIVNPYRKHPASIGNECLQQEQLLTSGNGRREREDDVGRRKFATKPVSVPRVNVAVGSVGGRSGGGRGGGRKGKYKRVSTTSYSGEAVSNTTLQENSKVHFDLRGDERGSYPKERKREARKLDPIDLMDAGKYSEEEDVGIDLVSVARKISHGESGGTYKRGQRHKVSILTSNSKDYSQRVKATTQRFMDTASANCGGDIKYMADHSHITDTGKCIPLLLHQLTGPKSDAKKIILNEILIHCVLNWRMQKGYRDKKKGDKPEPSSWDTWIRMLQSDFNKFDIKYDLKKDFVGQGEYHAVLEDMWEQMYQEDTNFGSGRFKAYFNRDTERLMVLAVRKKLIDFSNREDLNHLIIYVLGTDLLLRGGAEILGLEWDHIEFLKKKDGGTGPLVNYVKVHIIHAKNGRKKLRSKFVCCSISLYFIGITN